MILNKRKNKKEKRLKLKNIYKNLIMNKIDKMILNKIL